MKTRTYNPGTPGIVHHIEGPLYEVESHRERGKFYIVNLDKGTCGCPHNTNRGVACKHAAQVRLSVYRETLKRTENLTVDQLRGYLRRYTHRPEMKEAIERAIWERMNR